MNNCNTKYLRRFFLVSLLVSLLLGLTSGQDCACSPAEYEFTFDFSLDCPPVSVTRNGGVESTFCQIADLGGFDANITDLVPTEVSFVDILELASNFSVINQQNRTGPFVNGDSFTFGSVVQEAAVTKTLQLNIYGSNTLGQPIVNYFAISFTNVCDVYPVFGDNDFAGWVMFTNFEPPPRSACPAVPIDTPTSAYEPSTPSPTPEKTPDSDAPATSPVTPSPTSGSFETESPTSMSMSMSMNYDYTFATLSEFGRSYIIKNSKKASKRASKRSGSASESGDDESRDSKRRR